MTPKTSEQLAAERANAITDQAPHTHAGTKFTCDECPQAPVCRYVFDAYNTNGDCLADK